MLTKINRQDCTETYRTLPLRSYDYDKEEETFFYPAVFSSYILTFPSKSFNGHAKALGVELTKLAKAFQADALIFLGDTGTPWLYQQNDYKPVKAAQAYLTGQKIGKRFNGGLRVGTTDLPTFIKHLAWLVRCNAALPDFHFINETQSLVGRLCQYGNLHVSTLNEEADNLLKAFVQRSKFTYGDKRSCANWLVGSNAIAGRKTMV